GVVLGISRRLSQKRVFRHIDPVLRILLNWATTYGILLFMIFYFSESGWMFDRLFEVGNVEITAFLLILVVLIVSFA
ncbi:mechanosensitive ion channel family protein, partial [Bacillus sp. SIMBA_161]